MCQMHILLLPEICSSKEEIVNNVIVVHIVSPYKFLITVILQYIGIPGANFSKKKLVIAAATEILATEMQRLIDTEIHVYIQRYVQIYLDYRNIEILAKRSLSFDYHRQFQACVFVELSILFDLFRLQSDNYSVNSESLSGGRMLTPISWSESQQLHVARRCPGIGVPER